MLLGSGNERVNSKVWPIAHACWHEVQQRCRKMEHWLDESHMERHVPCEDIDGNLTADACSFCERGIARG